MSAADPLSLDWPRPKTRRHAFDVTVRLTGRHWDRRAEIEAQLAGIVEEYDLGLEFLSVSYLYDGGYSVTCWPPEDVEQLGRRGALAMTADMDWIQEQVKEVVERVLFPQED